MIFVDTGFLFAMVSIKDEHHHRVLGVLKPYEDKPLSEFLLTTNHVVGETLTMLQGLDHQQAVRMGEQLYAEKLARLHWATREEELEAFAYLRRHQDKEYSFVDCLSFVIMDRYGIREAWAVDSDFEHRFIALPGPLKGKR